MGIGCSVRRELRGQVGVGVSWNPLVAKIPTRGAFLSMSRTRWSSSTSCNKNRGRPSSRELSTKWSQSKKGIKVCHNRRLKRERHRSSWGLISFRASKATRWQTSWKASTGMLLSKIKMLAYYLYFVGCLNVMFIWSLWPFLFSGVFKFNLV